MPFHWSAHDEQQTLHWCNIVKPDARSCKYTVGHVHSLRCAWVWHMHSHARAAWWVLSFLQSMFVAEWSAERGWEGQMLPYGPLHLEPAAQARLLLTASPLPRLAQGTPDTCTPTAATHRAFMLKLQDHTISAQSMLADLAADITA